MSGYMSQWGKMSPHEYLRIYLTKGERETSILSKVVLDKWELRIKTMLYAIRTNFTEVAKLSESVEKGEEKFQGRICSLNHLEEDDVFKLLSCVQAQ